MQTDKWIGKLPLVRTLAGPALSMSDRKAKTAFLFLNQIRENIRMSPFAGGGDVIYPGGKSIEHYCSVKARVRRGEVQLQRGLPDHPIQFQPAWWRQ